MSFGSLVPVNPLLFPVSFLLIALSRLQTPPFFHFALCTLFILSSFLARPGLHCWVFPSCAWVRGLLFTAGVRPLHYDGCSCTRRGLRWLQHKGSVAVEPGRGDLQHVGSSWTGTGLEAPALAGGLAWTTRKASLPSSWSPHFYVMSCSRHITAMPNTTSPSSQESGIVLLYKQSLYLLIPCSAPQSWNRRVLAYASSQAWFWGSIWHCQGRVPHHSLQPWLLP